MSINKSIKNACILSDKIVSLGTNAPSTYNGSQMHQYYSYATTRFADKYSEYASDFVTANVQGLNPDNFNEWQTQLIRIADATEPTAATKRTSDDYKYILFKNKNISYIPLGAKVITMGSTWLAVNPTNVSAVQGTALIQKCNATWNYLDYYGNILQEPMIVTNHMANANNYDAQDYMLITRGYFDVIMQKNEFTQQLGNNSRIILGKGGYQITGFSDFIQEFTGDVNSAHLLYFTIRYSEPNDTDDMTNGIAGGNVFSWDISINGNMTVPVGGSSTLSATSIRNNVIVATSETYPITYQWESSNENVATVSSEGIVEAVSEGSCEIKVTLEQNPANNTIINFNVVAETTTGYVEWLQEGQNNSLQMGETVTLEAVYYQNGQPTEEQIIYTFSGANEDAYTANVSGNIVSLTCWDGAVLPLVITAQCKESVITKTFMLMGL